MIYMQDVNNISYTSTCFPDHEKIPFNCSLTETKDLLGKINNWATTAFLSKSTSQRHHLVGYTTSRHYNVILIKDLENQVQIQELNLGKSF